MALIKTTADWGKPELMNLFLGQNVARIKAIVDWGQPELTRGLIFLSRTT
jgi:hypothetical protein